MPKELVESLKKSGRWRPDGQAAAGLPARDGESLMIAELGAFCLALALALALAQTTLSAAGWARRSRALQGAGEGAAAGAFLAIAIAFFALMAAFVRSDFSVANVAANSHTAKPLLYKVAAVWGSHEGSMLLWCLALTGYGAVVALTGRGLPRPLKSLVVACRAGSASSSSATPPWRPVPSCGWPTRRWRAAR